MLHKIYQYKFLFQDWPSCYFKIKNHLYNINLIFNTIRFTGDINCNLTPNGSNGKLTIKTFFKWNNTNFHPAYDEHSTTQGSHKTPRG